MKKALLLALLLIGCKKEEQCPANAIPEWDQSLYQSGVCPDIWDVSVCGHVVTVKGAKSSCTSVSFVNGAESHGATVNARLVYSEPLRPCGNEAFELSVDVSAWKGFAQPDGKLTVNVDGLRSVVVDLS